MIINKLRSIKNSPERYDYHPERLLGRHIALVTLKALLLYGDIELIIAGLLHDICKPDGGVIKLDSTDQQYLSNPDHPQQAYEFCKQWKVHKWIKQMGAEPSVVESLVLNHMRAKVYLEGKRPKRSVRELPFIYEFVTCDDMIHRIKYNIPTTVYLPDLGIISGNITYIGQLFIDIRRGNTFTITINRTPYTYYWNQIPEFFDEELKPFIEVLI